MSGANDRYGFEEGHLIVLDERTVLFVDPLHDERHAGFTTPAPTRARRRLLRRARAAR